ncbi:hemerythrin domain-containing protein [Azospirillum doebereinerae]|uniref:Hemerythrin domain-containing protein n=1 Tax=Azospirillum doebereinerae TaxID=92933 RepID=A0A433J9I6_9PROT|nr:hemerythrin domain-containing protein [Azospirillum doebereinerae]MCG5242845.1 hemerythrin domain-containing protein [Azospirillum doebereinerae]RUQ71435.1 hemerythrin domain-containing protein [Azospirillum doebereinerae]
MARKTDIFARIKTDHDTIRALLDKAEEANGNGRAVFEDLQRELWAHAKVEEGIFYASLSKAKDAKSETIEGLNEHHLINGLLDELNAMKTTDSGWKEKLQVLGELVRHHLDEEEEELFEEAKEYLDDGRAAELGGFYADRKDHVLAGLAPLPK